MAKKRGRKKTKTTRAKKKTSKNIFPKKAPRKKIIVKNLLIFAILFVISWLFYYFSTAELYINLFFILSVLFGFISLAFLISLLVYFFMKVFK